MNQSVLLTMSGHWNIIFLIVALFMLLGATALGNYLEQIPVEDKKKRMRVFLIICMVYGVCGILLLIWRSLLNQPSSQ